MLVICSQTVILDTFIYKSDSLCYILKERMYFTCCLFRVFFKFEHLLFSIQDFKKVRYCSPVLNQLNKFSYSLRDYNSFVEHMVALMTHYKLSSPHFVIWFLHVVLPAPGRLSHHWFDGSRLDLCIEPFKQTYKLHEACIFFPNSPPFAIAWLLDNPFSTNNPTCILNVNEEMYFFHFLCL